MASSQERLAASWHMVAWARRHSAILEGFDRSDIGSIGAQPHIGYIEKNQPER